MKPEKMKNLFFQSLIFGLLHKNTSNAVKLHAFCIMNNHVHKQVSYSNGARHLSHFMRVANGLFGLLYNRLNERTGKVANERPKTPLIGDTQSQMRVHFYIEANPLRAGRTTLAKLRFFTWSSYGFYAYGKVDEYTKHLTPPDWYVALGKTAVERQAKYRELFKKYLEQSTSKWKNFMGVFIGSADWMETQLARLKNLRKAMREAKSHFDSPDPLRLGIP